MRHFLHTIVFAPKIGLPTVCSTSRSFRHQPKAARNLGRFAKAKSETPRGGYPTARDLFGTTHMTGDYAKIAEGMGAVGITVTQPGEVANALKQARQLNAEGKTVLLDIHTNLEARRSNFD